MRRLSHNQRGGERGAVLILVALLLSTLVLVVALVIDFSFARNTRQHSKGTTDATATAGLQSLVVEGVPKPWRGACAALAYLRANEPDRTLTIEYLDGNTSPVSGDPCASALNQDCIAGTPSSWAWIRASDGDFVVDIRTGYVTPDPAFPEDQDVHAGDDGISIRGGCDQIAVIAADRDDVYFGGIAGATGYDSAIRTVGRVSISAINEGVPAFLMLERTACGVLSHSVGTGGGLGIIVEAASATEPGIIHLDSSGSTSCNDTETENGYTLYGTTIGSSPGIQARPAGSTPGIISLRSLTEGYTTNAWATTSGVSPAGGPGGLVSRLPVDEKYNPLANPTIANIHSAASADANRTAAPSGYTTITTCTNHVPTAAEAAATLVFINCPGGYQAGNATFAAARDVIVNGPLQVPNNARLYFPSAQRIVVGGTSTRGLEVNGGGILGINSQSPIDDNDVALRAACTGREGPAWPNTTRLVIFGGSASGAGEGGLNVSGRAALCQTFVYLAGPKSSPSYIAQQIADGTVDATCVAETPCPRTTGNTATNASFIVSGFLRWSAPNQLITQPPEGSVGVEDLSLWTETAKTSEVKSGGLLEARGVHFVPNARVEMRSPAVAAPQDAQFIARSLKLFQGTLRMQPTPGNNVEIKILTGLQLVR